MPDFEKYRAKFTDYSPYHHVITDTVRHVTSAAGMIVLKFEAFGGAATIKDMILNVPGGNLELSIENMKKDFMGRHDHHFMAYYSLLDGYTGDRHSPGTGDPCEGYQGEPDWPIYCPPPLMS